ncbi:hypothetical protein [Stenotrophomonas sp.]|uniref:hypothetical protein n=1 Tax=Stenotrophomonas sp. TaxID=69392 RepID=UPI0028A82446|nr:hypothetical protein [Stenotrophomonas sp.]
MGIFDKGVEPQEFESFKKAVSSRFDELERKVVSSTSESAEAARESLAAIQAHRLTVDHTAAEMSSARSEISEALQEISNAMSSLTSGKERFLEDASTLEQSARAALNVYAEASAANESVQRSVSEAQARLEKVDGFLEQADAIPTELEALSKQSQDAKSQADNIKLLLNHSLKRKAELDELHKEVFGHDVEGEDGNTERVDGLRDELEKTYESINSRLSALSNESDNAVSKIEEDHRKVLEGQQIEFSSLIDGGRSSLSDVSEQLKALLPGALAAGLSAAYESKKDDESAFLKLHEKSFRHAVFGLIAVSLIPFAVGIYQLVHGVLLTEVIRDTPQMVISILPLYFPVLWLAYSSNKRLNLSKRLIEEYTHKAVLGRTFSGLSNQIESLSDGGEVKNELRTRLLFNVLQVSAENPGKLITDYNKTDHPVMDVLEKSAKLSESVETLLKIPGFGALAKVLSEKRDNLLKQQDSKIEAGMAANEELDPRPTDGSKEA